MRLCLLHDDTDQMPPIQGECVTGIGNPVPGRHSQASSYQSPTTISRPTEEISTLKSGTFLLCTNIVSIVGAN